MSQEKQGLRGQRSPFSWLAFAALGLVWGSSWIATDTLGEYVPLLRASAFRFLLASLFCLPAIFRQRLPRRRAFLVTLGLAVTMVVLPTLLLRWVRPQLPSATVAVLFAAMPLLLAFSAPRAARNASIVALGAVAFTLNASFSLSQAGAAAVVLVAVASMAASSLAIGRELRGESPVVVTALMLGTAGVLLLVASVAMERGQSVQWTRGAVVALVFLAVVAGAGAYVVYVWLLQSREAYQVATLQWIEPLVALLESALLLGLRPGFGMIAGVSITFVCLGVAMRARPEDDDSVSLLGN